MKKKKAAKLNPNDATLRNVRAINARVKRLELAFKKLRDLVVSPAIKVMVSKNTRKDDVIIRRGTTGTFTSKRGKLK